MKYCKKIADFQVGIGRLLVGYGRRRNRFDRKGRMELLGRRSEEVGWKRGFPKWEELESLNFNFRERVATLSE